MQSIEGREEGREEETNKESTTRGGHEHFLNDSLIFYFEIFNFESFLSSAQQKKTQNWRKQRWTDFEQQVEYQHLSE